MTALGDLVLGILGPNGRVAVVANTPELARKKIEHSHLVRWEAGRFSPPVSVNWSACALLTPDWPSAELIAVGPRAQLLAVDSLGAHRELSPVTLSSGRVVRGACMHLGSLWVVGTHGTVLEITEALVVRDHSVPTGHFECICAAADGTRICAGLDGVIAENGVPVSTPTNLILTALCASPRGDVYAVGQAGIVLRRRAGKWESLPQAIREDLWSCVWFENTLYASSYKQLFMLENDELCTVELPDNPGTFGHLSERGPALLSTGAADLLLLLPDRMESLLA